MQNFTNLSSINSSLRLENTHNTADFLYDLAGKFWLKSIELTALT